MKKTNLMPIQLYETPIYTSATAKSAATKITGTFYLYDGKEIHGRYRVTNSMEYAGMLPQSANIKGYENKFDLR